MDDTITLVDYNPELEQQFESTLNEFGLLPTLRECYKNPSKAKIAAYTHCNRQTTLLEEQLQSDSKDVHFSLWDVGCLSYNRHTFTYGARIGVETYSGERIGTVYVVITGNNALYFTNY